MPTARSPESKGAKELRAPDKLVSRFMPLGQPMWNNTRRRCTRGYRLDNTMEVIVMNRGATATFALISVEAIVKNVAA